jgi:fatty-acyl-CoA synthase
MAWIVRRDDSKLTAEELTDFCRGKIAHFKVPRYIRFVGEFPMTVTGKVQKFKMREVAIDELKLEDANAVENA